MHTDGSGIDAFRHLSVPPCWFSYCEHHLGAVTVVLAAECLATNPRCRGNNDWQWLAANEFIPEAASQKSIEAAAAAANVGWDAVNGSCGRWLGHLCGSLRTCRLTLSLSTFVSAACYATVSAIDAVYDAARCQGKNQLIPRSFGRSGSDLLYVVFACVILVNGWFSDGDAGEI